MEVSKIQAGADRMNAHLEAGGKVVVSNYLKATVYSKKHGLFFVDKDGDLSIKVNGRKRSLTAAGGKIFLAKITLN